MAQTTTPSAEHDGSSWLGAWLAATDDLVVVLDEALRIEAASASLERLADPAVRPLAGRALHAAALFGSACADVDALLGRALAGTPVPAIELGWTAACGTAFTHRIEVIASGSPGQRRLLITARDVAAQRRVEDELRRREHEFRTLAQNSPDIIIRYGPDLRAVYCNREIEDRVASAQVTRIVGRTPREGAPPGMVGIEAYEAQLQRTLVTGEGGRVELQVPGPGGEQRVHHVVFAAEYGADGAICGAVAVGRDVTDAVRMHEALARQERQFRTLAENSPDVILRYGLDGRVLYCNAAIVRNSGVPVEQVIGRPAKHALPRHCVGGETFLAQLDRTLRLGEAATVELQSFHENGRWHAYSVAFCAERDDRGQIVGALAVAHALAFFAEPDGRGQIVGALAVAREVTDQVLAVRALQAKEREFRSLAENAVDNIARWAPDARLVYVNPVLQKLIGPRDVALGRSPADIDPAYEPVRDAVRRVFASGHAELIELRLRPKEGGGELTHELRLVPEHDDAGRVVTVLGIGRDVTERIRHLQTIESLVRTDSLTRLANRQALLEQAPALFSAAARRGLQVGVMLLDLDQFKGINDGMGHSAGDELLREIARRLNACMRGNDLLVRLGGDEFVILVPDIGDPQVLRAITDKLHHCLGESLSLGAREVHPSASIGVAVFPTDGNALEELLAHADSAMYHAKRLGRGRTEYYRRELSESIQRRLMLEAAMHRASSGEGLELLFQPQVCMHRPDVVIGAEALLRWRHPSLGLLTPDVFIALAEETGLIVPMGRWVLRQAAEAAARWNRPGQALVRVAVNVSTRQFVDDDLAARVREVLAQTGCQPDWLSVEITESVLLQDSDVVQQVLGALRDIGVRVAIDDFGTGYSALNYLARFHVDCLKIDKSFVQSIDRGDREAELVKAFIAMAGALRLELVAEGVETEAQARFLLGHGCSVAQGYLYGRPMPAERFAGLLPGATAALA